MTELLLNTTLNPQQRDLLETVRSSGDALLTIIDDILDFSKIESGKLELEAQPFNLRTCIEAALDLMTPKAAEKGLELAYVIDPTTPDSVMGDITRLRQILVNLLGNAVKFTSAGEISVSVLARQLQRDQPALEAAGATDRPGSGTSHPSSALPLYAIRIAVKDTGTGIASDRLDRLFHPFSQVDSSINRNYGGTGLGLVICQRLCELMGGRIWVDSEEGQGSTFSFSIVVQAASDPNPTREASKPLAGKSLLLFDCNSVSRQHLILQAQAWDITVYAPQSALELLSVLQSAAIDLIVLDGRLFAAMTEPTMATLRHQLYSRAIPVLRLAANRLATVSSDSWLPHVAVLPKPVKQAQFYDVLLAQLTRQLEPVHVNDRALDRTIQPSKPSSLQILLAEDNRVNQKVALLLLQQLGYNADIANNGLEAIAALRKQSYDVILMDVQMPEMDGLSATRYICEHWEASSRPRIIAMTANAMAGDRELCFKAGMDDYLSKPIRIEILEHALQQCCPQPPAATAGAKPDCTTIDLQALQRLRGALGDDAADGMAELIDCYLTESPKLMQAISEAIYNDDAIALNQAAHTLKSSSAYLGAIVVTDLCTQLEAIGQTGNLDGSAILGKQLEAAYEQARIALQQITLQQMI